MNEPVTFEELRQLVLSVYAGTAVTRDSDREYKYCHTVAFDKQDYKALCEMANRLIKKIPPRIQR